LLAVLGAAAAEDGVGAAGVGSVARPAAGGAARALRVEGVHEEGVASLLVGQVENGEVHGRPSGGESGRAEAIDT
jgi:hypothetical protein